MAPGPHCKPWPKINGFPETVISPPVLWSEMGPLLATGFWAPLSSNHEKIYLLKLDGKIYTTSCYDVLKFDHSAFFGGGMDQNLVHVDLEKVFHSKIAPTKTHGNVAQIPTLKALHGMGRGS